MRRFRIVFAGVCLVLLVPLGLLAWRAVAGVELERELRHRAVAERVFDELERALSGLLAREEERPFGHYGFSWTPPGQLGNAVAVTRSPLSELPALEFVVGYFQVDPDGTVHTPLRPRDGEAPDWQPSPDARARIALIERTVDTFWRATAAAAGGRQATARPLPGGTVSLDEPAAPSAPAPKSVASAYDALETLNKGAEQRAERQAKLSLEYPLGPRERTARTEERRLSARMADTSAAAGAEEERDDAPAAVELPPMVGRVIDAGHLVLYRTVVVETRGYRQGLLIDLERLGGWLRVQALGASEVGDYATLTFTTSPSATPHTGRAPGFAYAHRFAEPFDDLGAELTLRPLPGTGGLPLVYVLTALLLVTAGLGLAALYRMVSVVVSFADRRQSFVAAVSHELKTPLTAIRMYGEMLRDGMVASEDKRAEYYRHITVESERLSRLINNVLEFSRLEKGTRELALVTGSVAPVVTETADLLRPHVEGAGFELRADVDPRLGPVRFERDALMQMIFNLVDNAVKYAVEGEPRRITIRGWQDDGHVRLAVRDHGPGVPARHLGRIFEPFYRGENELTRRSKGTGLGLALVRGLAERMGARVSGRNIPDGGFEVEIALRAT